MNTVRPRNITTDEAAAKHGDIPEGTSQGKHLAMLEHSSHPPESREHAIPCHSRFLEIQRPCTLSPFGGCTPCLGCIGTAHNEDHDTQSSCIFSLQAVRLALIKHDEALMVVYTTRHV